MSELYLKWMDRLYLFAMAVAGISLLVMTIVIPIGIFHATCLIAANPGRSRSPLSAW